MNRLPRHLHPWIVAITSVISLSAVAASLLSISCRASNLPMPDYTSHPTSALIEVPYPPPPARVEAVPKRPNSDAVWIDGEWQWETLTWAWKSGRWIVPPSNARYAPWTSVRDRVGTLYVAAGAWRDAKGNEVTEPIAMAAGKATPAAIVNSEGQAVPSARIAKEEAGTVHEDYDAAAISALMALDAAHVEDAIRDASSTHSLDKSPNDVNDAGSSP